MIRAGCHVARERKRPRLYGWSLMPEKAYLGLGLTVTPNADGRVFGNATHMDIGGWPPKPGDVLDRAQDLSELECDRVLLPAAIESGYTPCLT